MRPPRFPRACVAGAAGGFGRVLGALLAADGSAVTGVDLRPPARPPDAWLVADATSPPPALTRELARTDLLVLCLPEAALYPALEPLVGALPAGALVVDTTSVKSRYAAAVAGLRPDVEFLSIEPMFAPDVGFAGQHVAAVPLRAGPRAAAFRPLLRSAGARITEVTADRHDRRAATAQVAVHAALLAFGAALRGLDRCPAGGPSTPVQRVLVTLVARVTTRDPAVYWHIQRDNPHAAAARAAVRDALAALDAAVAAGDRAAFDALLAGAAAALGPDLQPLAARSAAVVRAGMTGREPR